MGYHPYDATHVITQLEILLFSAAFTLLNLWGKYPLNFPQSIWMRTGFIEKRVGVYTFYELVLEWIKRFGPLFVHWRNR